MSSYYTCIWMSFMSLSFLLCMFGAMAKSYLWLFVILWCKLWLSTLSRLSSWSTLSSLYWTWWRLFILSRCSNLNTTLLLLSFVFCILFHWFLFIIIASYVTEINLSCIFTFFAFYVSVVRYLKTKIIIKKRFYTFGLGSQRFLVRKITQSPLPAYFIQMNSWNRFALSLMLICLSNSYSIR